jgi:hypothetical protein
MMMNNEMQMECVEDRRVTYRGMVGRREVNRPLVRPKFRWKDITKIDLQ